MPEEIKGIEEEKQALDSELQTLPRESLQYYKKGETQQWLRICELEALSNSVKGCFSVEIRPRLKKTNSLHRNTLSQYCYRVPIINYSHTGVKAGRGIFA